MRRSELTIGGVRSPVWETGPQDAEEAVVFVHGNPGPARDWEGLAGEVGQFARTVAPDFPGYGEADKPSALPYTGAGYARHLAGIIERLGITRAHLVLHDFGGMWGLEWAAANPDRFASVTLINTGVLLDYRWHTLARVWRTPVIGELFGLTSTRPMVKLVLNRGNPRPLPEAFIDRIAAANRDPGTRRAVLALYRATDHPDRDAARLAAALGPLGRPALVIWGAGDPYLPVALAERQREVFPNAEVVTLPDAGHWPFVDDPGAVATPVVRFLRAQLAN